MTARAFAWPLTAVALVGLTCIVSLLGCNGEPAARNTATTKAASVQPISELTMALDALRQLNAPNSQEAGTRAVFYLNQWLSSQKLAKDWSPDEMLRTLPSTLQPALEIADLKRASFDARDLSYLQQNQWLADIAERVRKEPPPEHLKPWLKELGQTTSLNESEQLAAAERLFDWTVRNVQLDELPPAPKAPTASVGGNPAANTPPLRGEVGPGYGHAPWQILLYGHGDKLERSRIFLQLARQIGIAGGMLAIADPQSAGNSEPWCCALILGDNLYLFDAELGLPIPASERKGIATLKQLTDEPELLRQLDIEGGPKYGIEADDLKRIVALIDAEPVALSRRMEVLQTGIPKSRRMVVSFRPSELQARFRKHQQVGQISLWRVPFEANLYEIGWQQRISQDAAAFTAWNLEHSMFSGQHPVMRARDMHFRGEFADEGARELYLQLRPSEKEIDRLGTSTKMREQIGLNASLPEDPAQRSAALEHFVGMARRAKQNATYWLGLTYFEDRNYEVAREWLARALEARPRSPWSGSARYNLARANEMLGDSEKAVTLYRADDSPQRHGNLLRAQWLESQKHSSKSDGDDSSEPTADNDATPAPSRPTAASGRSSPEANR